MFITKGDISRGIMKVYALSLLALVSDFILVLCYLDDVILLVMLVALTIKWNVVVK